VECYSQKRHCRLVVVRVDGWTGTRLSRSIVDNNRLGTARNQTNYNFGTMKSQQQESVIRPRLADAVQIVERLKTYLLSTLRTGRRVIDVVDPFIFRRPCFRGKGSRG
jgi:hypothetical protein